MLGVGHPQGKSPVTAGALEFALVLSGGNALGAYQAGAYEALHERGFLPDRVAGASVGAINGAIICGNAPLDRLKKLRALWTPAAKGSPAMEAGGILEDIRRSFAAMMTLAAGRPGVFVPRYFSWLTPGLSLSEQVSLHDTLPLRAELERLLDFDLLNAPSAPAFLATAIDIETGEDVAFDSRRQPVHADHLRASAALLPAFAPVEIDGRLFGDPDMSANLPLDCALHEPGDGPLLCFALDLLPLHGRRPGRLSESVLRMQDLLFATQSRRTIAAWQTIFDERAKQGEGRPITLFHLAYRDQDPEVSGKAFDFSGRSAAHRWQAGFTDTMQALDDLAAGTVELRRRAGMSVYARPAPCAGLQLTGHSLVPSGA